MLQVVPTHPYLHRGDRHHRPLSLVLVLVEEEKRGLGELEEVEVLRYLFCTNYSPPGKDPGTRQPDTREEEGCLRDPTFGPTFPPNNPPVPISLTRQ